MPLAFLISGSVLQVPLNFLKWTVKARVRSKTQDAASDETPVGIVGTFDVENYGDLLFPMMAKAALGASRGIRANDAICTERPVRGVVAVSSTFHNRFAGIAPLTFRPADWGGQIIRFDKYYVVPTAPNVHLPIAFWLIPAVLGALTGKPVVWNAIGAWTGSPPAPWYDDVLATVLAASHFVGVRDIASQRVLAAVAPDVKIQLVPDTAFSIRFRVSGPFRKKAKSLADGVDQPGSPAVTSSFRRIKRQPITFGLSSVSWTELTHLRPYCYPSAGAMGTAPKDSQPFPARRSLLPSGFLRA